MSIKGKVIYQLEQARTECRKTLSCDAFSFTAKFGSDYPCLCGKLIQQGEQITRVPYCSRWIHTACADLDRSDDKPKSKAFELIEKLANQANETQGVWKEDLLNLAKTAYLGKWSEDYWLEDTILATQILDIFGMHKLTIGIERRTYASKLEKEFAKRKGWICRRCRHLIWVEKSVNLGVGPVCRKHLAEDKHHATVNSIPDHAKS